METINYQLFLKEIAPFENYLFYKALKEKEVVELESSISRSLPPYYREFLLTIGIYQDVIEGLFINKNEWIEQNGYLGEVEENYVMIGDNGGEEFWLLRTDDTDDRTVYNWVDDEIEETGFAFEDLLERCLNNLKDDSLCKLSNDKKALRINFVLRPEQENKLSEVLGIEYTGEWIEDIPNFEDLRDYLKDQQLSVYNIHAKLNGQSIEIRKEYSDKTKEAVYTFGYNESLSVLRENSKIEEYQTLIKEQFRNSSVSVFDIYNTDLTDLVW
ncbi:SMI1/KNR4 family protein [Myroides odoratimimus]|uniref:SMI1/KNR4 family protein n=1 Tax=Myroides odoratimimus TaxID=76832 RepID=UPI0020983249|nr:SMI1/KNR4 family protein [Myroides odoratimimus]MCO7724123.1 SMI1/KNR4 family protein [Myroides odoratimimus]MDM1450676.1 SMI1/KNR4 family protein [Myroides odoratimimus]MEC4042065.1 SMI1/KNR4 family protein [Myroides odoratimimus]MEC4053924.1 SMI1/KNR4 family protein [Myroides odoratimimus]MEC4149994.1 SMI1/KNR4 family protein [Myroides odoratimimus]